MTVSELIKLALKASGVLSVGQTGLAEDFNDAFTLLNAMLTQWNKKRWLIPNLRDNYLTTSGASSYTVGPGGDIPISRPDHIEAAYIRIVSATQPYDIPLDIISAYEDWARISLKSLVGIPLCLFYDNAYPLGTLRLFPVAINNAYQLHIITKTTIGPFLSLDATIGLPDEYTDAMLWNLAVRLKPSYGMAADRTIIALAKTSLNVLRGANAQIPVLRLNLPLGSRSAVSRSLLSFGSGGGGIDPATLPTTLPANSGVLWNNGGVISIS